MSTKKKNRTSRRSNARLKVIAMPFDVEKGAFADAPLDLLGGARPAAVTAAVFESQGAPWLSLVVTLAEEDGVVPPPSGSDPPPAAGAGAAIAAEPTPPKGRRAMRRYDAKELLPAAAYARFEKLREWRNKRASDDLVPRYLVLSNRQLGALAEHTPSTLEELRALTGFGPATVERYGEVALEQVEAIGAELDAEGFIDTTHANDTDASEDAEAPEGKIAS